MVIKMEVNYETIQKYNTQLAMIALYIAELEVNNKGDLTLEEDLILKELLKVEGELVKYFELVKYLDGKTYIGNLGVNDFGKYYIKYIDDNGVLNINHYSCGNKIEIELKDLEDKKLKWYIGNVEHDGDYYYFTGHSLKPKLQSGMKVRYRTNE